MKKKGIAVWCMAVLACMVINGCTLSGTETEDGTRETVSGEQEPLKAQKAALEDGAYLADFDTDSGMFHVSEACNGKGTLTVTDGKMMLHVSLPSKNILNLFPGTAEDAEKDGAEILKPTADTVTYSDGFTEEVYGFDIPVPALDEEFDLALIGKKGKWYDHKVRVSNPVKSEDGGSAPENEEVTVPVGLEDGEYTINVTLEGGSGRATVASPAAVSVKDGITYARIEWSSPNYDYMKVDGERYEVLNTEGNSVFEIPVMDFGSELPVTADTVAMSTPHEIGYTLKFDLATLKKAEESSSASCFWDAMKPEKSMELKFAKQFSVDYYENGMSFITIKDGGRYLVVPKESRIPENLPEDVEIIKTPLQNIYLVATSSMDFFRSLDGIGQVTLSGTNASGWYLDEVKKALEDGRMSYAGKYSAPDYELILSKNCDLAIESTMIYHSPEVKEQLEKLGIPVLVERSSYESHPLGRMEWIKLYGALLGKEELAEACFQAELEKVEKAINQSSGQEASGKTVAFFYISSNGYANVRKPGDYVAKMIELAGGKYVPQDMADNGSATSTMNMQMEAFYAAAKEADYMIYNSTIDGELKSIGQLLEKSPLLAGFKAVKEGHVWCTEKNMFQETMGLGDMIVDIHKILSEENPDALQMTYIHKLQ